MSYVLKSETLVGYNIDVIKGKAQSADARGNPIFNGDGSPQLEDVTEIVLVDAATKTHRVVIPLNDTTRKDLIKDLMGGVVVP